MVALAIFLPLLLLTGGGLVLAKMIDQMIKDSKRKTYRLAFPTDLDPDRVTAWLRSISGTLRTDGLAAKFKGIPSIALEVWATNQGIVHRLKVPWQYEAYIRPRLESLVPGVRLIAEETFPTRVWVHAVEVGLKSGHRPLRIPNASDLSTSILANFGALQADETLMMQWVIAPAVPQHKPIFPTQSKENGWKQLLLGGEATRDEVNDRRDKLEEPNMLAVLRVAAVANTPVRSQFLVRGVMSSLDSSRGPANHFYRRMVGKAELQSRIERGATGMHLPVQLSSPELTAAIGWPLNNPLVAGLPAAVSRYLPATESVPQSGRVIGVSTFPGRERRIAVSYMEARKHMHVLGGTGAGKTTLLANMFKQDVDNGFGVVLIENKGDLFKQALDYIPETRINDVIVMDVNDVNHPVGFNILQQGDPATIVDELNMVFDELYRDNPSLWMKEVMYHGLHTLGERKQQATFIDLASLVSPDQDEIEWRDDMIRNVKDPQLRNFWQRFDNQPRARQDQIAQPVLSRVWPMSRSKLRNIVGQAQSTFYMANVVRENKILLVNLEGIERGSATLMGTLILNALWQAVKRFHSEKGIFLYLDEFHHYMNLPVDLEQMLVESRSMGLGMVLAHQYLDQLTAKNMEEAIMSNARTKVAFALSSTDARTMANNFGKSITQEDFLNLAKYEAVSRVSTGEGVSSPLTLNTLAPARGYGLAGKVRAASRAAYSVPVNQVQDEILARRSSDNVPKRTRGRPSVEGWGTLG